LVSFNCDHLAQEMKNPPARLSGGGRPLLRAEIAG